MIGTANARAGELPSVHVAHPAPCASTAIWGNSTSPHVGRVWGAPKCAAAVLFAASRCCARRRSRPARRRAGHCCPATAPATAAEAETGESREQKRQDDRAERGAEHGAALPAVRRISTAPTRHGGSPPQTESLVGDADLLRVVALVEPRLPSQRALIRPTTLGGLSRMTTATMGSWPDLARPASARLLSYWVAPHCWLPDAGVIGPVHRGKSPRPRP
jgi:hypothetical protein